MDERQQSLHALLAERLEAGPDHCDVVLGHGARVVAVSLAA
jgi:hypothetical protein